jgi:putative ABC transport system ATP-binding protein
MSAETSRQEPAHAFAVRGLTKVYGEGAVAVHALRGVDLDLFEGEITVLVGPSGSGKSTLLNIIGGLDVPSAGQVLFRDREITAFDERALTRFRRDHIGFVFQFYNLIPSLTARENVELITAIPCPRPTPWHWSAWANGSTIFRRSCRAASSSGSPWRAPLPSAPM